MSEDGTVHALVRGRVQGVGFRYFVQRQATALGLHGWVRNLEDGEAVELVAQGPRQALDSLVSHLKRGPRMAFVERVEVREIEAGEVADGFEIRP